ncbi:hypothetical protein SEPCBS119000_001194 [Sporothrix epigloea]|uniref:BZIP domain-containing protein n=1 Tax=Sporothrix epigloea TaxID=1892477 RepID=A0ABP0D9D8_9PEZI
MPPKTKNGARLRQLSVEGDGLGSDMNLDSDVDGDFDPVQAALELKRIIDGHKKRRFGARRKIEEKYEYRVAEIVKRTEIRLAEREKSRVQSRQKQMNRLVAALEVRDAKQRAVADKIGRFFNDCMNLASLLQTVYASLAEETQLAVLDEEDGQGEKGQARLSKVQ